MKWVTWLLLATSVASGGCLNLPAGKEQLRPKTMAESNKPLAPPPPVVLPEQVKEDNLAQTVPAFQAELEYAANEPPLQLETPAASPAHP